LGAWRGGEVGFGGAEGGEVSLVGCLGVVSTESVEVEAILLGRNLSGCGVKRGKSSWEGGCPYMWVPRE
jgi:hypothetical protein